MAVQGSDWNRPKRKRKTIDVTYDVARPTLKVTKITGKHLECMGIPVKGGYELYPEEAVYLLEARSAAISTVSGKELSVLEAYSILENNSVPMYKYEAYKHVKRTGLVILRPRKSTIDFERFKRTEKLSREEMVRKSFETVMNLNNVPTEQLCDPESFPSFVTQSGSVFIKMKVLHSDQNLVNFLPSEIIQNFSTEEALQRIPAPTTNSKRRKSCRPIYWPLLKTKHVSNWSQFNFEWEKMRQSLIVKRFRRIQAPPHEQLRRQQITTEPVDFHIFSPAAFSHRLPARPLFSLICHRVNGPCLNVSKLSKLRNVVLAVEESGKVNFLSISGGPIDLNFYLQAL
ncbi:unnamed protein product [Caenorhabditis sp. 36 PRJEB53466]|nr:unnamed protein product [Caenorhabditis sp. 36 PRJEB53466]